MFVSDTYGFIYLHVPKTAGLSLRLALRGLNGQCYVDYPRLHLNSTELRLTVGNKRWNNYYKFAFVRNPWDWNVSLFRFLMENPRWLHLDQYYKELPRDQLNEFVENLRRGGLDFWIRNSKWQYYTPTKDKPITQVSPYDWIKKPDRAEINIFQFEKIDESMKKVSKEIGTNIDMPFFNTSMHEDYREYYRKDLVDYVHQCNIELIQDFKYEFGYGTD